MLKLTGIQKSFDGLPVLSNLSLTLSQGEIVALIGPSGCGKTTLLNIISELTTPDAGTVEGAEGKLSYMFQNARLLPWRTVEENIRLVREDAPGEEVRTLIAAVGLEGFEHYYPGQLSGGMARRCALARAFHFGGSLFLMDEPFQGLDYGIRMEMVEMLLTMWRREKPGVLFVTHEIDEALTVATRIAVLTPRPTTIQTWYTLPGAEGREASAPELLDLRREIIRQITGLPWFPLHRPSNRGILNIGRYKGGKPMEFLRNLPTDDPAALAGLIDIRPARVVSMALTRSEHCQMTLLAFGDGESVSEERYFGDTLYYVLEGSMPLRMESGERTLTAGQCLAVPAGVSHAVGGGGSFKLLQITLQ